MVYKRKFVKKARKAFIKKIQKPYITGNPKRTRKARMNLYSEVAALKKVLNVEKKRVVLTSSSDIAVGQCIANANGWYAVDITPVPAQGSNNTQRNGSSIKLTGSNMLFSIKQQSATTTAIKCKFVVFHITGVGQPYTPATFIDGIYYLNTFVQSAGSPAIVDYNSQLDIDQQRGYKILAQRTVYLPYDATTSVVAIKNFRMGLKYKNHHVRFDGNNNTVNNGQLILYIQPDVGNASPTTASTLTGIPVSAVNTGMTFNYNITHYFIDN